MLFRSIIGHRTIELVINPPDKPPMGPKILDELKTSAGPVNWTVDEDGASYFCMGLMIPQLNWILVLRQARGEIYAHVYNWDYIWGHFDCHHLRAGGGVDPVGGQSLP